MKVTNICWDYDVDEEGEIADGSLPDTVTIPDDIDEDDIADYLSDEYGFCVYSFDLPK